MTKVQDQDLDKIKEKHSNERKKIEKRIRDTPVRSVSNLQLPASSEVVMDASAWHRTFAKYAVIAAVITSIAAVFATIALSSEMSRPPEVLSYLMDRDGRIVKLESVRSPSVTETQILSWASEKMVDIHTLSFTDYGDHVQQMKPHFERTAWVEYQKALINSKDLDKIKNDRLNMWAEPIEAPKITYANVENGVFTWKVEMKLRQFMGGGNYMANGTDIVGTMTIKRVSRGTNLAGVVITKYLAKEIKS